MLSLRSLLTFGRIRPVDRDVAKALYAMSHNETLRRVIEARAEDQWELWELLDLLAEAGFRPASLWKAHPGEAQSICGIVPPEAPRMFSLSSAVDGEADELHLTVGGLRYETPASGVSRPGVRFGTGSNFLAHHADGRPRREPPASAERDTTPEVTANTPEYLAAHGHSRATVSGRRPLWSFRSSGSKPGVRAPEAAAVLETR